MCAAPTPAIWIDVSTVRQLAGRGPVGFSRVVAPVLSAAMRKLGGQARYWHYDRYSRTLREDAEAEVSAHLARMSQSDGRGHGAARSQGGLLRAAGRGLEHAVRHALRRGVARGRQAAGVDAGAARFQRGDVLLAPGDPWMLPEPQVLEALTRDPGVQVVAICYDAIAWLFPHQMQDPSAVTRFERYARFLVRDAALTICISRSACADLGEFARANGLEAGPSTVVNMGADLPPATPVRPPHLPQSVAAQDYVLSVSTVQIRKNYQLLYNLWRRMAERRPCRIPPLVIAGARGWLSNDLLRVIERDPLVKDHIHVLHGVDDAQLAWLYANCRFTMYPSLYEGWGVPIPEGFFFGKACIASDTSSIPEASQGLALHLDPLDFRAWYETLVGWLTRPQLVRAAEERVRAGYRHITWAEAGERIVDLALEVAAGRLGRRAAVGGPSA
jgi:hypothetical protein